MKRLLFFFLLLITGISYGQNPCPCSLLRLSNFTGSDPTVNNGNFWYRSDLNKFRIRANNATDNVATEGYVGSGFLPLTLTENKTVVTDGNILWFKSGDSGFTDADSVFVSSDFGTGDVGPIFSAVTDWTNITAHGIIGVLDQNNGTETAFLKFGGNMFSPHTWRFHDYRTVKTGIEYENPDTTDWNDNTLSTKKYVVDHVDTKLDAVINNFWNEDTAPTLDPESGVYSITASAGNNITFSADTIEFADDRTDNLLVAKVTFVRLIGPHNDNSAGGSLATDVQSYNFWFTFGSGRKIVTTVKVMATAVEGSTGDGYYSSEKVYIFLRDDDDTLTLLDSAVIYQKRDDVTADHVFSVSGTLANFTLTTPANTEYQWEVHAEVSHSLLPE